MSVRDDQSRDSAGLPSWRKRLRSEGPFGFGASGIGNLYREVPDAVAAEVVGSAWRGGLRYYDTAPYYGFGLSERRLGNALSAHPRASYLLSTKVGRLLQPVDDPAFERHGFHGASPFEPQFDYSYDGVMTSFEQSLDRLGVDTIDILLMHDLGSMTHGDAHRHHFDAALAGLKAMAELRDQGVVSAIGLGVNEIEVCEAVLDRMGLDVLMLAGRYTLLDQSPLDGFFERCAQENVGVIAAGIYNSGILASGVGSGRPGYFDYQPASPAIVAQVSAIETCCARHDVDLAAAALQFVRAHPAVDTAVIGMATPDRVAQTERLARQQIRVAFWDDLKAEGLLRQDAPTPSSENET